MKTAKFETGATYQMRFIGDNELRPEFVCIKRTAKTATFKGDNEIITRKIKTFGDNGSEYIVTGNYSMAPSINAEYKV